MIAGDHFLARAVRARDQHRHVGAGHLGRHLHDGVHRIARVDDAAQVEPCREGRPRLLALALALPRDEQRRAQLQQVAHRRDEARVVPGLGQVVGRAGPDEFDGGLEVRPRGQQHDRQVGLQAPQRAEQRDALLARGRLAAEVHVLDHEVDVALRDAIEPGARRVGERDLRALERQQHLERRAHGLAVVDHEYRPATHQGRVRCCDVRPPGAVPCGTRPILPLRPCAWPPPARRATHAAPAPAPRQARPPTVRRPPPADNRA